MRRQREIARGAIDLLARMTLAILGWGASALGVFAQEGDATKPPLPGSDAAIRSVPEVIAGDRSAPVPWRLRRVLVPESRLSEVVQGSYLPVPRERFDSLIEADREATRPPIAERGLAKVTLTGRLDSDGCLQGVGTASLDRGAAAGWIESRPPSFWLGRGRWHELERARDVLRPPTTLIVPDATRPSLGLDSTGSPISRSGSGSASLPTEAAMFSAIQGWGPKGNWIVEGIGATQLTFDWMALPESETRDAPADLADASSRSGLESASRGTEFLVSLPDAVRVVLYLDLPESLRVESRDAMVRREYGPAPAEASNLRRWRIDLTPSAAGRLRLVPSSTPVSPPSSQPLNYETQTIGRVGVGSIELRTTVRVGQGESGDLIWSCPEGWSPVWDETDGSGLRPESLPMLEGDEASRESRWIWRGFSSSSGPVGSDRSYTIAMRREYDLGELITLTTPRLEGRWQRGDWNLMVEPRIAMQEIAIRSGTWSPRSESMETPVLDGERNLRWDETAQDFSVTFRAALEPQGLHGVALTEILAEGGKVSASCRAWLHSSGEPRFVWHGQLSEGWVVDRVSAIESGVPDVSLIDGWDLVSSETDGLRLEVRFSQPLRDDRKVMVTIDAHRLSFPSAVDSLSSDELRLISWDASAEVRHWLGLRAESPYRLEGSRLIPPPSVTGDFDEHISAWRTANPSSSLMLLDGPTPAEFALRTESDDSLEVEVEIDATLFERSTRQEVVMRCRPIGGRPTNLRIAWDRPSQGDWQWRLYLPERGVSYPVQALEDGAGAGETLLSWGIGVEESFELVGVGTESWESEWRPRLPLRYRNGMITVASRARSLLTCTVDGDARLPASVVTLPEDSQLLSVVDLSMLGSPMIVVRSDLPSLPSSERALVKGYIERAVLESWPGAVETRHRLNLEFSDPPPATLSITPPPGARWTGTLVGGRRYRPETVASQPRSETSERIEERFSSAGEGQASPSESAMTSAEIAASPGAWSLPMSERRPGESVVIEFLTSDSLPRLRGPVADAFPEVDCPIVTRHWRLYLPHGYQFVADAGTESQGAWAWIFSRWTGAVWRDRSLRAEGNESESETALLSSVEKARVVEWTPANDRTGPAILVRSDSWVWVSLGVLLGSAFLMAGVLGRRATWSLPFAALTALWLPADWADLSWTLLPASVLAVLVTRVIERPSGESRMVGEQAPAIGQGSLIVGGMMVLLGCLGAMSIPSAVAQEPVDSPIASRSMDEQALSATGRVDDRLRRIATLYIPVDESGNERKDLLYVPRDFYDELVREAPRGKSAPAWLIEAARHTIEAETNPFGDRPRMRVTSRYRVRTLDRAIAWPVPDWGDRLAIQPGQVQVDSMPARLSGTPSGDVILAIDVPGVHEVVVTATGLVDEQGIAWEGTAPLVVDSEIRVASLSGQGLSLMAPSFWLETDRLAGGRKMRLGPTGMIRLASRDRVESSPSATPLAMLEYLEPLEAGPTMTVWISAGPNESLPEQLLLRVAGDWDVTTQMLPEGGELRVTRGVAETECLLLPGNGESRPESVAIRLVSTRGDAMGRQALPQVSLDEHPIVARFLAWQQPNQLVWSIENDAGQILSGIDSADSWWTASQLTAMGIAERDRRLVARPVESQDWLRVAPVEPILDVDHQWQVRVTSTETRWEASSLVSVMRGEVAALELQSTVPMEVDSVSLVGPDRSVPVDFLRLSPERVLLTLPSSQRTAFQLLLRGTFLGSPLALKPLPVLDFPRIDSITHRATFERTPEVAVMIEPNSKPSEIGSSAASEQEKFALAWQNERRSELLGEREEAQRWATWQWRWQPTVAPRIDRSLTRFVREGTAWRVTLDLHVADDESWGVDRLDWDVPAGFVGLPGETPGRWETATPTVPAGLARFVPDRRLAAGSWIRLEGQLSRFPDGKTLPQAVTSSMIRRLVAVPPAGKEDAFLWKYERYLPIDDADSLARLPDDQNWLLLEAEDSEATIRLASKPQIARPSRVFLAEHRVEPRGENWVIDSRMMVDPGGRRRLLLRLPEDSELIALTIDGETRVIGDDGMLDLTSRELPQVVRVLIKTTQEACLARPSDSSDSTERVCFPRLDLEVLSEVVAVRHDATTRALRAARGATSVSPRDWIEVMEEARQSAANSAATIAGLSPVAVRRWSAAFLADSQEQAPEARPAEAELESSPESESTPADPEVAAGASTESNGVSPRAGRSGVTVFWSVPDDPTLWSLYAWRGTAAALQPGGQDEALKGRNWGSAVLVLGSLLGWGVLRRGGRRGRQWLSVLLMGLGAAVVFSSEPAWPGILVILMAIPGWFEGAPTRPMAVNPSVPGTSTAFPVAADD